MTEIAVETLKEELSHYLERAQKGERILIHDRGHSIAHLDPRRAIGAQHRLRAGA